MSFNKKSLLRKVWENGVLAEPSAWIKRSGGQSVNHGFFNEKCYDNFTEFCFDLSDQLYLWASKNV
jgi:hypothetical protein